MRQHPIDIRNDYLKQELKADDYEKGKALIQQMETAYGGKELWLNYKTATFVQRADWYGKTKLSHWDTTPQRFEMRSELGTDNSKLTLLNGKNNGKIWGIQDGTTYVQTPQQSKQSDDYKREKDKLLFKNYWFQFPFRIGGAAIISYAGEEKIEDTTYDLVYATWGSEAANADYDQFILYLNQDTHLLELLHFTVRDKFSLIHMTAHFDDFRTVDGITFPHAQYVRANKPSKNGLKFHENHYEEIWFGDR